ncbi:MAG: 30S ribosome-binding factor RbfA [Candidatus Aminicenantales bacterium]
MKETRRQKRVSSLIKEELSRLLISSIQDSSSGLITVTRVRMSSDLKTAYVEVSVLGHSPKEEILELIDQKKGHLRKAVASRTKLKYNPMLVFSLDETWEKEEKIDKILKKLGKDEEGSR